MNRYKRAFLLFKELGPSQLLSYALYQAQLRSGSLAKHTPLPFPTLQDPKTALSRTYIFNLTRTPDPSHEREIILAADDIVAGNYHPFSGGVARLDLTLPNLTLQHWTHYGDQLNAQDIKSVWEPFRFSWVYPLCQAFSICNDEKYARTFWNNFEIFVSANPQNQGPNWSSAQEVALRLIPWVLAAQTFAESPESTPQRVQLLLQSIWQHADRINQTLNYSRAQNNNHLLSEAVGLMIGGLIFSDFSHGQGWLKQGVIEFQKGIRRQVDADGTYCQYSNNYHRLMLQLALLFRSFIKKTNLHLSKEVNRRLAQATCWLIAQMDIDSGHLPNFGHNDGSNLLPLGCGDYRDFRPIAQASSRAFLNAPCFPPGPWDELSDFLAIHPVNEAVLNSAQLQSPAVHRLGNAHTWATLHSQTFKNRPAHADMLHVDIWHNGVNFLADAGTFAYNLAEPWQNSLSGTVVHNTVSVAMQDQMIREGKFLWLERARAFLLPTPPDRISSILYCNLRVAYTQIRTLLFHPDQTFVILDQIELARLEKSVVPVTIQYLLPDWPWQLDENTLVMKNQQETFKVKVSGSDPADHSPIPGTISLIRAGEALLGSERNPIRGWISTTYLEKSPALSFAVTFKTAKSLEIKTELIL